MRPCGPKARLAGLFCCAAAALAFEAALSSAWAQSDLEADWVRDEPSKGYQPLTLRPGSFIVAPELRQVALVDTNVFRSQTTKNTDVLFLTQPTVNVARATTRMTLTGSAIANIRRYAETSQENLETFNVDGEWVYRVNRVHSFSVRGDFGRLFERRDDPEANDDVTAPPTLINGGRAGFDYRYRPGRFGFAVGAEARRVNFLGDEDEDRDLTTYRATGRALFGLSSRLDAFVEGFGVWRDARLDVDRTGVNRDSETYGVNAGISIAVTEKLSGEVSVGGFDFKADDPTLDDFAAISAGANLRWAPRERTTVTFGAFRGNVNTIRNGASGRVDTRFGLGINQTLRHNVRARARVGYRRRDFRTSDDQFERDLSFRIGAEYVLNRHIAIEADYSYVTRQSTVEADEFNDNRFGVGLAFKY